MTGNIRDRQFSLAYFCSHLVDFLFSSLHWPGTSDPELHLSRSRPPFRIRSTPYISFYPFFPDTYCALSTNSKEDINRFHRKKERKNERNVVITVWSQEEKRSNTDSAVPQPQYLSRAGWLRNMTAAAAALVGGALGVACFRLPIEGWPAL